LHFSPGGVPDDESILLDTFKDGAFGVWLNQSLLYYHFADNKESFRTRFQWSRTMRAKIHSEINTVWHDCLDENFTLRFVKWFIRNCYKYENKAKAFLVSLQKKSW
jgi:1-acyl-sn-glycerol-3-phosphate acyltransferase